MATQETTLFPIGSEFAYTPTSAPQSAVASEKSALDKYLEAETTRADRTDSELRQKLGMRALGEAGTAVTAADQAGGDVGYGTAIGSAMSGAGTGAQVGTMFGPEGTAIGAVVGGVAGLGTGLLAKYEADKAKQELKADQRKRKIALYRQQKEWLAKNKDRLALEGKVDMAALNAEFNKYLEDEKTRKMTQGMTRMDTVASAIKKNREPAVALMSEIF